MINSRFIACALLAAVLFAVGCSAGLSQDTGSKAPDFTLPDTEGKAVSLSQYAGRVVILDFFADWCPPCRREIPDFIELEKIYGPKGFSMVGVALVGPEDAKRFAEETGINYPVLIDDGKVSDSYGPIRSIPTTFVIDKDGKIAKKYIGYRGKAAFEADIQALLK
jgi:cytochrome c biogenesis protein CcmG/thiol:disulfide interchange protein DsbE